MLDIANVIVMTAAVHRYSNNYHGCSNECNCRITVEAEFSHANFAVLPSPFYQRKLHAYHVNKLIMLAYTKSTDSSLVICITAYYPSRRATVSANMCKSTVCVCLCMFSRAYLNVSVF